VDMEYTDPSIPALQLARRFFAVEEAEAIASQKGNERLRRFYKIWVQKEACLKALGLGLSVPLDGFTVPFACDPPVLYDPGLSTRQGAMVFCGFWPFPTYVSALVTGPPVPQIRLLEWPTEGPYKE